MNNENLKLTKKLVNKGDQTYTDFNLVWTYEGKEYQVRVKPVFKSDYDKLFGLTFDTENAQ